jgi:phage tail-like protein
VPEAADTAAQVPARTDPFRNYNFKLSIGNAEAYFTECSGIGVKVEALKYREGGLQQVVRRLPGRVEYADITLRYGVTASTDLWQWFLTAVEGRVERKHVSIRLMNDAGTEEKLRWDLFEAWPSAWRGAPLDAMGNEVAIESLTLVYESLQRA